VAARLASLCASGDAEAGALARALVRCGAAFLPNAYASLAAELSARLHAHDAGEGGSGGAKLAGSAESSAAAADATTATACLAAAAAAWRRALSEALAERLAARLSGGAGAGSGIDELAAQLAAVPAQPPTAAGAAAADSGGGDANAAAAPAPPPSAAHAAAGRADAAAAVVAALVAAAEASGAAAAANASCADSPPAEPAAALCRLVCRLGPVLAASAAADVALPALDALLRPLSGAPCGGGAAACAAARRASLLHASPAAAARPLPPCAVCAARALRADGWASPGAALFVGRLDDGVGVGSSLTEEVLLGGQCDGEGGAAARLEELRAAVAALPWRQAERSVLVAGRPLRLAQRPRDVRPRRGGAGETGLVLWGAALLLAWHLEHAPAPAARLAAGARVLEIGCGAGLCAAAAALLGGRVVATDGDDEVVALAAENAAAALADAAAAAAAAASDAATPPPPPLGSVHAARLRWGDAADAAALPPGPYELILASDVVYFTDAHDALFATLLALAAASPGCEGALFFAFVARCFCVFLPGFRVTTERSRCSARAPAVLLSHTWRKPDAEAAFLARLTSPADAGGGGFTCEDVTPPEDAPGAPPRPHGTRLLRLWQASADGRAELRGD
jgi:SAM-dependent methyltransferase